MKHIPHSLLKLLPSLQGILILLLPDPLLLLLHLPIELLIILHILHEVVHVVLDELGVVGLPVSVARRTGRGVVVFRSRVHVTTEVVAVVAGGRGGAALLLTGFLLGSKHLLCELPLVVFVLPQGLRLLVVLLIVSPPVGSVVSIWVLISRLPRVLGLRSV
jgi:hypothetical protein